MVYKCKICGGDLALVDGSTIAQCEYCGSTQTVPSANSEKKLSLFNRANRLRSMCEFDKAAGVYETIVADFPEEAEAYWGLVLCKFGIEYVDDPSSGRKIPTCHRSSFRSVMEDADFEQALENADSTARKLYRDEAKQIEDLRKGILEISNKADSYEVFICYKETDKNGNRTLDSVLAQDIYDALTDKGYHVFFSRITLEDKLGQEYEPYIFAALNSAKVMLAIGTDYEHYNAVWVRNEWGRYLKLMTEDHSKHLIPCFKGIDAYDIPKEFAKLQAQDFGKIGAMQDLLRGIDKLITPTAVNQVSNAPKGADIATLLSVGAEALESREWRIASNRFDLALTIDPKCADAHLGKLMVECKCTNLQSLSRSKKTFHKSVQYKQVIAYADDALKAELKGYCKLAKNRRFKKLALLSASVAIIFTLIFALIFTTLKQNYQETISDYYNGTISAETAIQKFKKLHWYKEPDKLTKYLLNNECTGSYPFAECPSDAEIPTSITNIRASLFTRCLDLYCLTIPSSVTHIGDYAFSGCTNLRQITIPDSVISIGDNAFVNTRLSEVIIPDSVTIIGDNAFSRCSYLQSITIPDSITTIGHAAFYMCSIKKVYFHSEEQMEKFKSMFPHAQLILQTEQ